MLTALAARLAALAVWPDNLTDDRDGYLALADGLAHGRGFVVHGSESPTAYRPPLYPLTLIPSAFLPAGLWTAAFHVLLGLTTVWLTYLLAVRLSRGVCFDQAADVAALAALLVAVDPLLLRYATLPMTETLAACLVTALLVCLTPGEGDVASPHVVLRSAVVGGVFGLAALCRPTVWAFAGLVAVYASLRWAWRFTHRRKTLGLDGRAAPSRWNVGAMTVAAALILLPWGVRNLSVFGRPILMTTHGGYTLLLGNNPDFYHEVVAQPWGTVWDDSRRRSQRVWFEEVKRQMRTAGVTGEVAQDRWLKERALANIMADPELFVRACWLRLRRFWGLTPVDGANHQPAILRWSVGAFYLFVSLGALIGLLRIVRHGARAWWPPLLMVAAFMGVHLFYWTNTRMRAPVIPVIDVLSAVGWTSCWSNWPIPFGRRQVR